MSTALRIAHGGFGRVALTAACGSRMISRKGLKISTQNVRRNSSGAETSSLG
jgi:hypothetical protein